MEFVILDISEWRLLVLSMCLMRSPIDPYPLRWNFSEISNKLCLFINKFINFVNWLRYAFGAKFSLVDRTFCVIVANLNKITVANWNWRALCMSQVPSSGIESWFNARVYNCCYEYSGPLEEFYGCHYICDVDTVEMGILKTIRENVISNHK